VNKSSATMQEFLFSIITINFNNAEGLSKTSNRLQNKLIVIFSLLSLTVVLQMIA
jgi:hypothetical protein